eukprot:1614551-Prymnesium_polylepis.2
MGGYEERHPTGGRAGGRAAPRTCLPQPRAARLDDDRRAGRGIVLRDAAQLPRRAGGRAWAAAGAARALDGHVGRF